MYINTRVVRALMYLRDVNRKTLAQQAGVHYDNLKAWLQTPQGSELYLTPPSQIAVLKALGVEGAMLRPDQVHRWHIDQRRAAGDAVFRPMMIVAQAFGHAKFVFFQQQSWQPFSMQRELLFGLKFDMFRAVLSVRCSMLRPIALDSWGLAPYLTPDAAPVVSITQETAERLDNAGVTPKEFDQLYAGVPRLTSWEDVPLVGRELGIAPEEVLEWMSARDLAWKQGQPSAASHPPASTCSPAQRTKERFALTQFKPRRRRVVQPDQGLDQGPDTVMDLHAVLAEEAEPAQAR